MVKSLTLRVAMQILWHGGKLFYPKTQMKVFCDFIVRTLAFATINVCRNTIHIKIFAH